jgi:adenylosuccinate lyase
LSIGIGSSLIYFLNPHTESVFLRLGILEISIHNRSMPFLPDAHDSTLSGFENPLASRYASSRMSALFSTLYRQKTWRRLWVLLAECESKMGLTISPQQLAAMKATQDQVDLPLIAEYEKKLRHDVMAAIHAWGEQIPDARGVIHLGATSCFVTDNGDTLIAREALTLVRQRIQSVLLALRTFALRHASLPTLGYTHFQPAQPTTVGKRATLWAQDLALDLEDLDHLLNTLPLRGLKGATGTQASFVELFGGDKEKTQELENIFSKQLGVPVIAVSGQTSTRKLEDRIGQVLCGVASSASKFANDIRLLQHMREIEEPFGKDQIGSSAMPYKRNPMRSERIVSLARFVVGLLPSTYQTSSNQWLERTLDDSAHRRLTISQGFLAIDAILILYQNIAEGLVVHTSMIDANLRRELPFLCAEILLMEATQRGGDRQALHAKFRTSALQSAEEIRHGKPNPLLALLAEDPSWGLGISDIESLLKPERLVGRAPEQTAEFIEKVLNPILANFKPLAPESPRV